MEQMMSALSAFVPRHSHRNRLFCFSLRQERKSGSKEMGGNIFLLNSNSCAVHLGGFLVSTETVLLCRWESQTKLWLCQTS